LQTGNGSADVELRTLQDGFFLSNLATEQMKQQKLGFSNN